MFSLDQYNAARRSAAFVERTASGTIGVDGADRLSFLHALLTNDITRLTAGTGCYAAYLTPQGRMISDMRVIETGGRVLLGVESSLAGALAQRLDQLIFSEDVQVKDVSTMLAELIVVGPDARSAIGRATGVDVAGLTAPYDNLAADRLLIVRDDWLGIRGFSVYAPREQVRQVCTDLAMTGALEIGEPVIDVLRIEAGTPRFGVDMDEETIPLEAGIEDRAISFTKGCYVGQEVIVRVLHRGHGRVARRLVGLKPSDSTVPTRGSAITRDGQELGEITSAVHSPSIDGPIALGYVQRAFSEPGTEVTIGEAAARVHALPFVPSG